MFSQADYELAARVLGLPVPTTAAEKAAAAPMTAVVIRDFFKAAPPVPRHQGDGINTGATASLNRMPETTAPMVRVQLGRRLQAGATDTAAIQEVEELLMALINNPELIPIVSNMLENLQDRSVDYGNYLSQQAPIAYDLPNYMGNYSLLNAPNSNAIPASQKYEELG